MSLRALGAALTPACRDGWSPSWCPHVAGAKGWAPSSTAPGVPASKTVRRACSRSAMNRAAMRHWCLVPGDDPLGYECVHVSAAMGHPRVGGAAPQHAPALAEGRCLQQRRQRSGRTGRVARHDAGDVTPERARPVRLGDLCVAHRFVGRPYPHHDLHARFEIAREAVRRHSLRRRRVQDDVDLAEQVVARTRWFATRAPHGVCASRHDPSLACGSPQVRAYRRWWPAAHGRGSPGAPVGSGASAGPRPEHVRGR